MSSAVLSQLSQHQLGDGAGSNSLSANSNILQAEPGREGFPAGPGTEAGSAACPVCPPYVDM